MPLPEQTNARISPPNAAAKRRTIQSETVETLKRRVLRVLKNGSNLRHVNPDEWLVVTFSGPGSINSEQVNDNDEHSQAQPADAQPEIVGRNPDKVPRLSPWVKAVPVPMEELSEPTPSQRLTVMTIRMKKENADAFAASKLTEDEFLRAAEVTTYLGPSVPNDGMLGFLRSAR
jgi:hypothetical protein